MKHIPTPRQASRNPVTAGPMDRFALMLASERVRLKCRLGLAPTRKSARIQTDP